MVTRSVSEELERFGALSLAYASGYDENNAAAGLQSTPSAAKWPAFRAPLPTPAARSAGNRTILRPVRAKQGPRRIHQFPMLFRPFRAENVFGRPKPRALPWADM